jgi:integrase
MKITRKAQANFTPRNVRSAVNGEIAGAGDIYRVTFARASGKHQVNYYYNFSKHPFKKLLAKYLFGDVEQVAASTINQRCKVMELLEEFMALTGDGDLTPQTYGLFLRWLLTAEESDGRRRFANSTIPSYANTAKAFYKFGLEHEHPRWTQYDLDTMTVAANKFLRGCRERGSQDSIDRALSFATFSDLIRAVALEFEQCKQVMEAREAGKRDSLYNFDARFMGIIDPNPFVVFALQAVMRHGLRAEELNALTPRDIRKDDQRGHHEIYIHAPNKTDDYIPVDEAFLTAWRLCEAWSQEARKLAGPLAKDLFKDVLFVYPPTNSYHSHPLMEFSSYRLNISHLPYFFKKWFNCKIQDANGNERPLLHADGAPTRPLKIDYKKLRNAFAVRFAEREKNRAITSRVMRHKQINTAQRYYLHQTRLDHAKKVQIALKTEANFIAMGLKNPIHAGVSKETLRKARLAGAILPQGICGSALEGQECRRAGHCLECPYLVVLESRKPRFIADRDTYLADAQRLDEAGDWRGAENALIHAKYCEAYLIRMEQVFGGGVDERGDD